MAQEQNIPIYSEQEQIRRDKLNALRESGQDPYLLTKAEVDTKSSQIRADYDAYEGKEVTLAGRIMARNIMGKASFARLLDTDGNMQFYIRRDDVGEEAYAAFKKMDIGDVVCVKGKVFKTKTGEISIHTEELTLLAKCLKPLPEKFHGLTDMDLRYRQRYLDMVVNPEVRDTFRKRSQIISAIRAFLEGRGFMEVETPVLHTQAGGAAARPFITHHNTLDIDMYLRIALELHLKRLIVGGFDRVYEIGRVFRNEGMDTKHNPEFTMLELYQAFTDFHGMMDITEDMFRYVARVVNGSAVVQYGDVTIDLEKPFARMSMVEAVKKYSGVDFDEIHTLEEARAIADERKIHYEQRHQKGDILNLFFDEYVEENLVQPTFIYGHPVEISPLAKKMPNNPAYTERFEVFILGREHGNAFSELNDPVDQRQRFEAQAALKAQGDEEAQGVDEDFLNALEIGMPPTGGLGVGVDRLVMLLTSAQSIRDVLLFPTMKPLDKEKPEKAEAKAEALECACFTCPSQEDCKAAQEAEKAAPVEEKIDFSNVVIEPLFQDTVDFETFSKSDFRAVKVIACEAVPKSKKLLKFTLDDGTPQNRTILSGIHAFYEPEQLIGKTCVAITNLPPRPMMGIESCGMLISALHHENGEEKLHLLMLDDHIPAGAKMY
ncbi:MAG: lysine--tRNA ligase [Clostridia bacterium]|nr:lysine--tRNA ligase [Clostridia bacterium]